VFARAAARLDTLVPRNPCAHQKGTIMIVLGIILLIAGFLLKISILWTIGIVLIVVGLVLTLLGSMGRAVGGRKTYY
jgi:membrane-bound ClpP family serine protease